MGPLDWLTFGLGAAQDIGNFGLGQKYAQEYDQITRDLQAEGENQSRDVEDYGWVEAGANTASREADWRNFRADAENQIAGMRSETEKGGRAIDRTNQWADKYRTAQQGLADQIQGQGQKIIDKTIAPEMERNFQEGNALENEYRKQTEALKTNASGTIARSTENVWTNSTNTLAQIYASDMDPASKAVALTQANQQFAKAAADQYNSVAQASFQNYAAAKANLFGTLAGAKTSLAGQRAGLASTSAAILDSASKSAIDMMSGTNTNIFNAQLASEAQDFNTRQNLRDTIMRLEEGELNYTDATRSQALSIINAARARGDQYKMLAMNIRGQQRTPLMLFNGAEMLNSLNQTRAMNSQEDMQATADRHASQQFWGGTAINAGVAAGQTAMWGSVLGKMNSPVTKSMVPNSPDVSIWGQNNPMYGASYGQMGPNP